MIWLLDTTAVSAAMRYEPAIVSFLRDNPPGTIRTAAPVVAELEYGIQRLAANSRKRILLDEQKRRLLGKIGILDWLPEASVAFGAIKAHLEATGSMIDDFDIAIAAIARCHGAEVVTANLVHFTRVPHLTVRHW